MLERFSSFQFCVFLGKLLGAKNYKIKTKKKNNNVLHDVNLALSGM
jgi:hypothetical protein